MFLAQLTTNILLFIIGLVGIVLNRRKYFNNIDVC